MTVATTALGVPGYTFADLHQPERLASLYERFCEEVAATDPRLWHDWDAYRRAPDAPPPPVALSNLLTAMAPHVSRFVKRLFDVDAPAAAVVASTRAQDDLFRFKVDFVRRRVLPLLKNGAHVAATPGRRCHRGGADWRRCLASTGNSPSRGPAARCWTPRRLAATSPQYEALQALVRRAHPRPCVQRLGRLPLPRDRRAVSPGRRPASGSAAARSA